MATIRLFVLKHRGAWLALPASLVVRVRESVPDDGESWSPWPGDDESPDPADRPLFVGVRRGERVVWIRGSESSIESIERARAWPLPPLLADAESTPPEVVGGARVSRGFAWMVSPEGRSSRRVGG